MVIFIIGVRCAQVLYVPQMHLTLRVGTDFTNIGKVDTLPRSIILGIKPDRIAGRFRRTFQSCFQFQVGSTRIILRSANLRREINEHRHFDTGFFREKLTQLHTGRNIKQNIISPVPLTHTFVNRTKPDATFTSRNSYICKISKFGIQSCSCCPATAFIKIC